MISEHELLDAIEAVEGNCETLSDCEKLAVYYTVYDHLFGKKDSHIERGYSLRPEDQREEKISVPLVASEFLKVADGMNSRKFWEIIDELVSTIEVINPKLYDGLLRKMGG